MQSLVKTLTLVTKVPFIVFLPHKHLNTKYPIKIIIVIPKMNHHTLHSLHSSKFMIMVLKEGVNLIVM
jgi:hypothetical protein